MPTYTYYQSSHVTNKLIPSDMSLIAGSYMHKFATSQLPWKSSNTNYTLPPLGPKSLLGTQSKKLGWETVIEPWTLEPYRCQHQQPHTPMWCNQPCKVYSHDFATLRCTLCYNIGATCCIYQPFTVQFSSLFLCTMCILPVCIFSVLGSMFLSRLEQ